MSPRGQSQCLEQQLMASATPLCSLNDVRTPPCKYPSSPLPIQFSSHNELLPLATLEPLQGLMVRL